MIPLQGDLYLSIHLSSIRLRCEVVVPVRICANAMEDSNDGIYAHRSVLEYQSVLEVSYVRILPYSLSRPITCSNHDLHSLLHFLRHRRTARLLWEAAKAARPPTFPQTIPVLICIPQARGQRRRYSTDDCVLGESVVNGHWLSIRTLVLSSLLFSVLSFHCLLFSASFLFTVSSTVHSAVKLELG